MAERSRPWSGIVTGDAGPYSDHQWTDLFLTFLASVVARQGVFQDQLNELDISSVAATPVSVQSGRALVNGIWYESDASESLAIASATAGNVKVDRIVAQADYTAQTVRLVVIAGTNVASNPVPTALVQTGEPAGLWELPLWQIHVTDAGVLTFFADDRVWLGLPEPAQSSDTHYFLEDEMFHGQQSDYTASENFKDFRITISGSYAGSPSSDVGIAGSGVLDLINNGAVSGFVSYTTGITAPQDSHGSRFICQARNPNSDANLDRLIGYAGLVGDVTPADGVFFRAVGAGNWFAVCREGGVETVVDTTLAPDSTNRKFEIRQIEDDAVKFLIDGVVRARINTNVNTVGAMSAGAQIVDSGAAPANATYMRVDRIRIDGHRP